MNANRLISMIARLLMRHLMRGQGARGSPRTSRQARQAARMIRRSGRP